MGARGKGCDGDGGEVLEFTVVGTAVKAPWINHPPNRPVTADLFRGGRAVGALPGWLLEPCRLRVRLLPLSRLARDEPARARPRVRVAARSARALRERRYPDLADLEQPERPRPPRHAAVQREDLHFSHKRSACGGRLDIDMNFMGAKQRSGRSRTVFWAHGGRAGFGRYHVAVYSSATPSRRRTATSASKGRRRKHGDPSQRADLRNGTRERLRLPLRRRAVRDHARDRRGRPRARDREREAARARPRCSRPSS